MPIFQSQFEEVKRLVEYEDYSLLTKRLIDFTLDTDSTSFFQETVRFLDWLDQHPENTDEKKEKFLLLLDNLYLFLINKPPKTSPDSILLSTSNLIKSYKKSAFALGPISFNLNEGEIIGLVGENGNGKTTLLRSLCGDLLPTGGKINYHFPYKDQYDLRTKLIYIPQQTPTWHGSLLSNLRFTATSYGILGEKNILMVELIIARMGLRKFRTYKWKELSSGYKMRFELARALLRQPRLLLIDEPLANLDIMAQQIILDDFRDISSSAFRPLGIILSSQQLYEVEKTSTNVIFLKNGTPRNLTNDTDVTYVEVPKFIIEFESEWKLGELQQAFGHLGIEKIQTNGGTYVACFPESVTQNDFLRLILEQNIPVNYFRNISQSTRRFFLS